MLSHEVKNYALLTYSGQLIVRGVALRSSRAEPFGVRFLRQALLCIMTDDIVGLRDAFLATVAAIRNRTLPAADMATRVRLSKTPEAYQASRAAHPEPAYEALLAAGRTRWFPGERVRFYRSQNKSYVWLPDEGEEVSADSDWEQEEEIDDNIQEKQIPSLHHKTPSDRRDYDIEHYLRVLVTSYAARLRKAFAAEDFEQLFRVDGQSGLFDSPIEDIHPRRIER
jgi:hypothetical protein